MGGAGARGAGILDVVGLVEDECAGPSGDQVGPVSLEDLVVEDDDVGVHRPWASTADDLDRARRKPALGFSTPVELQRGGTDDHGGERFVGLERGERLDRLA